MTAGPGPRPTPRSPASPEQILKRLDWQVVRRLDGLLLGDHRTLLYGTGIDFADLREYRIDDEARHIDWNVTARMATPFVRQYTADREIAVWFLIDRSRSMDFGLSHRSKDLVVTELVTALARLFTRSGNRAGAILWDNGIERLIEPRGGRNQVLRLARHLIQPPPSPASGAASGSGEMTNLAGLIEAGLNAVKRRSLVVIVSDFISDPGWERPLRLLARRHEVVAIRLWDQREIELPDAGVVVLQDAETGEQLTVDTGDPELRRRFASLAEARQARLAATLERSGADLHAMSTGDDLVRSLIAMAIRRRRWATQHRRQTTARSPGSRAPAARPSFRRATHRTVPVR